MNKEFISVLTYLTAFVLFLTKTFVDKVIMVETNRRTQSPDVEFGDFLHYIGICRLITENLGTNRAEYFNNNSIDISSGKPVCVNQFVLENVFKSI